MPSTDVVAAYRENEQEALAVEVAHEERDQIAGRAVDPVEVLEDDDGRGLGGQATEELQEEAEQARLGEPAAGVRSRRGGAIRVAIRTRGGCGARPDGPPGRTTAAGCRPSQRPEPRKQPSDLVLGRAQDRRDVGRRPVTQVRAQRLGDGGVGQAVVGKVEAAADQHVGAIAPGAIQEFADQARLADARFAGNDHDLGGAAGDAGQRRLERLELRRAPDEFRTRDGARHARESTRRPSL